MKVITRLQAFDKHANAHGPNWHRESPYASTWEPYRASWVRRHGGVAKWGGKIQKGGAPY